MNINQDPHIILMDEPDELNLSQMKELRSIGVHTIQSFLRWNLVEKSKGIYDWDRYDRYINSVQHAGSKLILRLPFGSPTWAPSEWFFRSNYGTNFDSGEINSFFSIWKEDATKYTEEFIHRACERYKNESITCCSCIGWYGETTFPCFMADGYYQHIRESRSDGDERGLWCFDDEAVENYRLFVKSRYNTITDFNRCNDTIFSDWSDIIPADFTDPLESWADTVEWYRKSAELYINRIHEAFLSATDGQQIWIATVPRSGFRELHIDSGMFMYEEQVENIRLMLVQRNIKLNQIWYSAFLTDRLTLAFHYWLLRHYPEWHVWVGAETAANIVVNSRRAYTIGCKGVIVSNPYSSQFVNQTTDMTIEKALSNINEAAQIWLDRIC